MFYRIFGGSGHGKTYYVFSKLSECIEQKKKAFLVVPEQSAVLTEREVITRLGAKSNLYVEVINFKRLCNRVFRETGGLTEPHLDDGARKLLMMLTLQKVSPFLKEYARSAQSAEFATKALSIVSEMKNARITPVDLENAVKKLDDGDGGDEMRQKISDIALIYDCYETTLCEETGQVRDIYERLCEKLKTHDFFSGTSVFFDSFYSFTAAEYEIISHIAEQADDTYVTFTCSKGCEDNVFARSVTASEKCFAIAERAGCEVCDVELSENFRHKNATALARFEKEFCTNSLSGKTSEEKSDESIRCVVCKDIYDEAKWALSKVFEFVRGGDRFSDIVICAKNIDSYIGIIDTFFEKASVPLGIDRTETLAESALFELCLSALEGASTFSREAVLRYVKTGLSGLSEYEADIFETYVKTWNISPSLMRSDEEWTMNPDGYVESEPDEKTLSLVNCAKGKVRMCLDALSMNLKSAKTVRDYCTSLYNLLSDIKKVSQKDKFYDGNDGVSLSLLYECLDSFVSCAGEKEISSSQFYSLFKNCASDYNTGHIPSLCNEVRFSSVDLVRCENVKHVILLGVNSSVFPSSCKTASLISDKERKVLKSVGVELSESEDELIFDELFLAYCAISSAKCDCHISYVAEDESASPAFPSVIVSAIKRICANEEKSFDSENFTEAFIGNEMLFEEMTAMADGKKKNTLKRYFSQKESWCEKLYETDNPFCQATELSESVARLLYDDTIYTSYSRLEKMAGCPFSHFCNYVLKLKPEPKAQLGPSETGSVIHKILEILVPLLCRENESGNLPNEDEAQELVKELLCRELARFANAELDKIPKRFAYLYNRLSRLLNEMAKNIVRELRVTKFKPCDFELEISKNFAIEPYPIDLGEGKTLYIVGKVDRVDVYEKDGTSYVRIVDYKTGKKTFKLCDIRNGFNLQMLLYLASIKNSPSERYGKNIVPAGVLYSNISSAEVSLKLGKDDIDNRSDSLSKPTSSGIFLDDKEILFAMDPTENSIYLPIGRKNGEATKKEAVASLEEMGELLDFACNTAGTLAKEMMSGYKAVLPFEKGKDGVEIDVCQYCDMKNACFKNLSRDVD